MPTTIKLKNSVTTTAAPTTLVQGEVAANVTDKKLWIGNAASSPVQILGAGATVSGTDATFTGVATFSAGTVSAPAITTTGDTNTGIFFPAADTIAFTEGGVESMRIDASGNIGLGSTPKAWSTIKSIDMLGGGASETASFASGFGSTYVVNNAYYNGTSWIANTTSVPTYYSQISGTHQWHTGTSVTAGTATSFSERMRIDSSGNVGIGTSSPSTKLHVSGGAILVDNNQSFQTRDVGGTARTVLTLNSSDELVIQNNSGGDGGVIRFNSLTGGAEAMRIESTGSVGIGTSSPAATLDLVAGGNALGIRIRGRSADNIGVLQFLDNGATTEYASLITPVANTLAFKTSNTERMRIDSSGNLLVGTTTAQLGRVSSAGISGEYSFSSAPASNGGEYYHVLFRAAGAQAGYIYSPTTSTTSYITTSDYRLKENIAPMTGALAKVAQLNPVTYKWKTDGVEGQGFIAHELQAVVPDCVSGTKDAVDAEGKPQYQGIDTSFLVATLTAAIQEQQAMIENLTNRLNALEGK